MVTAKAKINVTIETMTAMGFRLINSSLSIYSAFPLLTCSFIHHLWSGYQYVNAYFF